MAEEVRLGWAGLGNGSGNESGVSMVVYNPWAAAAIALVVVLIILCIVLGTCW